MTVPVGVSKTQDGSLTLYNEEISECYHSKGGALWESEELYIKCSGIKKEFPKRHEAPVRVLDVGLGLGYNALSTLAAWWHEESFRDLTLVSLEKNDSLVRDLRTGKAAWQDGWDAMRLGWCRGLRECGGSWSASLSHPGTGAAARWLILCGDGRSTLNSRSHEAWDYIWQDPFSPAKNPEMWDKKWFSLLSEQAQPGCRLMTYSVARVVREALIEGGWSPEKIPAPGPKRSWLMAVREDWQEL